VSRQIRIKNNVIFVLPGTPAGGPMVPRAYQAKIRTLVEQ